MRGGGSQETWANFLNLDSQISRFSPDEVQLWLTSGIFRRGLGIKLSETSLVRSRLAETSDPTKTKLKTFSGPLFSEKLRRDGRSACPELQCQSRSLSKEEGMVGDLSPVVLSSPFLFFHLSEWSHLLQTAGMKPTAAAATAAATPLSSRSLPRSGKTASYRSNKLVKKAFQGGINNSGNEDGEKERDNLF